MRIPRKFESLASIHPTVQASLVRRRMLEEGRWSEGVGNYRAPLALLYQDETARVSIGNYTSMGDRVSLLLGGGHKADQLTTSPLYGLGSGEKDKWLSPGRDVVIGSDVWVGRGATIMGGVTVGHGAIIASCSVVTRDVAPYVVVAGNPAEVRRSRFEPEIVAQLLELAWWDWPREELNAIADLLHSRDIEALLAYGKGRNS